MKDNWFTKASLTMKEKVKSHLSNI
jgi:hypothetical protein